ncbi:MAG: hypothetical protein ABJ314_01510, partial [Ilumatobacter sp.]
GARRSGDRRAVEGSGAAADTSPPTPSDATRAAPDLRDIEHWFVVRGVPHFVERKTDGSMLDAWTRALPLLVVAYLLLGLNALDLATQTLTENLVASAAVVAILIGAWAISNRLRGVPTFARPTDIDAPELALFLLGPAIPALVYGQYGDAAQSVITAAILLVLIYVWSAYGIGPLLRWGSRRGSRQIASLGSLVARALPLLLLFNTFLFINAEVWELAGTLTGPAYFVVLFTFFALGAAFALSRVPGTIRSVNTFESWSDIDHHVGATPAARLAPVRPGGTAIDDLGPQDQLRLRQRFNIGLVVLFGQALQITLVTVSLTVFFVGFGFFGITESTSVGWTRLDDIHILFQASFGGRELILSEPLIRVAAFLGAFSGMYFTVVLTTDDTYRTEFSDDVGPEIREALAVRTAYRVARGTYQSDHDAGRGGRPGRDTGEARPLT